MSFDTLLSVLFVIFFIVLPLVSRVLRARNRPRAGGQVPPPGPAAGPAAPPPWLVEAQRRVREAQARAAEASGPEAQQPRSRSLVPNDPFGPLAPSATGDLVPEEPAPTMAPPPRSGGLVPEDAGAPMAPPARSRGLVPEDAAAPMAPSATQGGLVPGDPFGRGLVPHAAAPTTGATLGREGPPPTQATQRRSASETMPGWAVAAGGRTAERPRMAHEGARLGPVGRIRFERESIVSGLIWHEILEEPAWRRRLGRRPSRLRSR